MKPARERVLVATVRETPGVASPAWTELGAAAPQPARRDGGSRPPARALRLRRDHRPVLGSFDAAGALLQRHAREVLLGPALLLVPVAVLNVVVSNLVYDQF